MNDTQHTVALVATSLLGPMKKSVKFSPDEIKRCVQVAFQIVDEVEKQTTPGHA